MRQLCSLHVSDVSGCILASWHNIMCKLKIDRHQALPILKFFIGERGEPGNEATLTSKLTESILGCSLDLDQKFEYEY